MSAMIIWRKKRRKRGKTRELENFSPEIFSAAAVMCANVSAPMRRKCVRRMEENWSLASLSGEKTGPVASGDPD